MTAATVPAKKKKTKRRRVSKHVLEAKKKAAMTSSSDDNKESGAFDATTEQLIHDDASPPSQTTKADASESDHADQAIAYLKAYIESKDDKAGESSKWKFNKNTQTWLIKHMYNADVVVKSTFSLLLEYFRALQGNTKSRVLQEATDRVLRYKEHEKQLQLKQTASDTKPVDEEDDKEKALRREYKRARQVVQILQ